eukprot:GHRR01029053.1.p1 GENE.GHRR01029053.1~~GHRR01029053.1.p1  ORF type:complete len:156 (-),score=38.99 GHRR01029053.1:1725-2123(-)
MQAPYTPGHYGQLPPHIPVIHEYQQLQVIRNQVNLKKTTLRLAPVEGSSTELELQFSFDASAPCRVSTFLLATEDPRQSCRIIAAAPEPRPPAYYQKGVSLQDSLQVHSSSAGTCLQPPFAASHMYLAGLHC